MGKDIQRYDTPKANKYLVLFPKGFTREQSGYENESEAWQWIESNYPAIANWLLPFEQKGKKRYDKGEFWWELRACDYYSEFEKPKIIYLKFQVKPAFIIDEQKLYSNDANFIYPQEDYLLLGILNSKLGWFLISQNCTEIQNGYQLIYDYFKNIPIPSSIDEKQKESFEELVKQIVELNKQLQTTVQNFINELELQKIPKKLQAFYNLSFDEFIKEYKKAKKIKFADKLEERNFKSDWKPLFEHDQKEALSLQTQINTTDQAIDTMVYQLYNLSDKEIAIVEEA